LLCSILTLLFYPWVNRVIRGAMRLSGQVQRSDVGPNRRQPRRPCLDSTDWVRWCVYSDLGPLKKGEVLKSANLTPKCSRQHISRDGRSYGGSFGVQIVWPWRSRRRLEPVAL